MEAQVEYGNWIRKKSLLILGLFRNRSLPVIENLDIPDEYKYMDDELIDLIEKGVEFHIQRLENEAPSP